MALTMRDLTVSPEGLDRASLLADWRWLLGADKQPVLLTAAGDVFVQASGEGSVLFLDTQAAELRPVAASGAAFEALLRDRDFVVDHLAVNMVGDLRAAGMVLRPGQVYALKRPMVLGGEFIAESIEPTDVAVHFAMLGQIHEQVRSLPPGTAIDFQID